MLRSLDAEVLDDLELMSESLLSVSVVLLELELDAEL